MLRKWQKLLQSLPVDELPQEKARSHDHIENFDVVEPPPEGEDQEQNHGGQDVCQDVPDAPEREEAQGENPENSPIEESSEKEPPEDSSEKDFEISSNSESSETSEGSENSELSEDPEDSEEVPSSEENSKEEGFSEEFPEEEDSDEENPETSGELNRHSLYRRQDDDYRRRLQMAFATIIGKVAEDLGVYATDGDDVWDVEALAMRRFDHRPLQSCRHGIEKERVVLALDFSGSCWDYSSFFQSLAKVAEKFGDVEVFDASNGFSTSTNPENFCITTQSVHPFDYFRGRTVIFFGDFDGGASLVKLSQNAKVYWFSCEDRYSDLDEHSWCENYTLSDFRGKYFLCFNERDFISLAKKIR